MQGREGGDGSAVARSADAEPWRLFVAVDLGAEARGVLARAQEVCHPRGRGSPLPVRWVAPAGAHLTIKFLGAVGRGRVEALEGALRSVAGAHQPFLLRTGPPGAFPNPRRPHVIWLGLTGPLDRLAALHGDVERALGDLGFPPEDRPFRPHLTLGRVREGARPDDFSGLDAAFEEIRRQASAPVPVDALHLMRSHLGSGGARYTTLVTAPLGGA